MLRSHFSLLAGVAHAAVIALLVASAFLSVDSAAAQTGEYKITASLSPFFIDPVTGEDITNGKPFDQVNGLERGADGRFYVMRRSDGSRNSYYDGTFQIVQITPTTGAARVLAVGGFVLALIFTTSAADSTDGSISSSLMGSASTMWRQDIQPRNAAEQVASCTSIPRPQVHRCDVQTSGLLRRLRAGIRRRSNGSRTKMAPSTSRWAGVVLVEADSLSRFH